MGDHGTGTLLTGGTGFLGGEVLVRLHERPVYVLVRAASDEEAEARLRGVLTSLLGAAEPWSRRAVAIRGDVTQPWLGIGSRRRDWLAERVDDIVHCAASVSFTLGLAESRAINVEGTRRLIELGQVCARRGGLDSFLHVSTAYVAGTHGGSFTEADLDVGQDFRNPYERTKHEAERIVRERGWALPIQIVRPSIVVGDSRTGWTPAFNVLYGPLKAFSRGAYPMIPARRSAPVDVVPVDYVADAIVALGGRAGTTHHLTAGERTSSVGELIELGSAAAGQPAPRVINPALYRRVIHPVLVRRGSEARRRALGRSEVYFPQLRDADAQRERPGSRSARPAGDRAAGASLLLRAADVVCPRGRLGTTAHRAPRGDRVAHGRTASGAGAASRLTPLGSSGPGDHRRIVLVAAEELDHGPDVVAEMGRAEVMGGEQLDRPLGIE